MFGPKLKKYENVCLFEVVGRGGETQLQVDGHLNSITCKGLQLVMSLYCDGMHHISFEKNVKILFHVVDKRKGGA